MGSFCSSTKISIDLPKPKPMVTIDTSFPLITDHRQIVLSPSCFVKRNHQSFHTVYKVEKCSLGQGSRGEVKVCTHLPTRHRRVVKIISKAKLPQTLIDSEAAFQEINILKNLDHPSLPRTYEYFEDQGNYYIVMEYCKGGDLFEKVKEIHKFEESQASEVMSQLLSGVNYLHSKGIQHRNLKLANLLLMDKDSLNLKIIDFDSATFMGSDDSGELHGTALYIAPEVLQGKHTKECDLWSCGIILYILLSGEAPFKVHHSIIDSLNKFQLNLDGPQWVHISIEAKNLLRRLLDRDPNQRISAAEACSHSWIKKYKTKLQKEAVTNTLQNLQEYRRTEKFEEVVQTLILTKLLEPKMYHTEVRVFQYLDIDKNGMISKEELVKALVSEKMNREEAESVSERVLEEVSSGRCGSVCFTDFLRAAVMKDKVFTKKYVAQAFRMMDQDSSGIIRNEKFCSYFSDGARLSDELINQITQVDGKINGELRLDAFQKLLSKEKMNEYSQQV